MLASPTVWRGTRRPTSSTTSIRAIWTWRNLIMIPKREISVSTVYKIKIQFSLSSHPSPDVAVNSIREQKEKLFENSRRSPKIYVTVQIFSHFSSPLSVCILSSIWIRCVSVSELYTNNRDSTENNNRQLHNRVRVGCGCDKITRKLFSFSICTLARCRELMECSPNSHSV